MARLNLKVVAGQFASIDTDRSGTISYLEFEEWSKKNTHAFASTNDRSKRTINHLSPPKGGWAEYTSSESDSSDSDIEEVLVPSPPPNGKEDAARSPVRSKAAFATLHPDAAANEVKMVMTAKRLAKKQKSKRKKGPSKEANLDLYVAQAMAHSNELAQLPNNDPRPRKARAACLPILVGLVFGLVCLFMIYGIAAKLGPAHTKLWLFAAGTSLFMKVFVNDMLKVALLAVCLKCADQINGESSEFLNAVSERLRQAAEAVAEGGEDASEIMGV